MDPSFLLNSPQLKNIAPEKLQLLMELSKQGASKKNNSPQDMAQSIKAASTSFKEKDMGFDKGETDMIIEVLKQNMSDADKKKADLILSMMKSRNKS